MTGALAALTTAYCLAAMVAFSMTACWLIDALEKRARQWERRAYWSRQALIRLALILPITALWPLAWLTLALRGLAGLVRDARGGPR